jgi:hypothetical protein
VCRWFQVISQRSQLCMEVRDSSLSAGAQVDQFLCAWDANQLWRFVYAGGSNILVNMNSGMCLDVSGASNDNFAKIQQWYCNGTVAQRWIWS